MEYMYCTAKAHDEPYIIHICIVDKFMKRNDYFILLILYLFLFDYMLNNARTTFNKIDH